MEQQSDERLMAAITAGEAAALAALVERHHSPLLGYLYRLVGGDRPLAEDLCQETFLRLMQQRSYQCGRPFKPWLYAIATNLARDHYKSAAVSHALRQREVEASMQEPRDTAPGPEAAALAAEQGREIAAALDRLGEEYRVALLLRFYSGFSLQEIADTLHIPLGTVKSRLSVGTHRLREMLTPVRTGGD
ncbi:MAG TPA: RNA polymerase sigma factor [Ktedonobacterales bacterium]|jgi:RNA polymerase sigma-70 factor (ECF subfamily)